jgi:lycopene beta-cyclase
VSARSNPAYRFAIVGAGLAGLSLARAFARANVPGRVAIVDAKPRFADDRTWSFWDVDGSTDEALGTSSWTRWQLVDPSGSYRQEAAIPYVAIESGRFYDAALAEIEVARHDLFLAERVIGIDARAKSCLVHTSLRTIDAEYVFDARGLTAAMVDGAHVVQRFAGYRIETARDTFDDGVATLMDVQPDTDDGFHFFYLLPFSPREALVENTYFARRAIGRARLESELERYIARRFGAARPSITYREAGAIPMSGRLSLPSGTSRVIPIGLRGGCARPGSGYTFHRVQKQAARIASAFADSRTPGDDVDFTVRAPFCDELLLAAARFAPQLLPHAFRSLFATGDGDALARFMMDCAGPADMRTVLVASGIGAMRGLRPSEAPAAVGTTRLASS